MEQYRTFWNRFFAGMVDGIIFMPLTLADFYIDVSNKYIFISWVIFYSLSYIVYSIYFHGKTGQTIGKKLLGIIVLDTDEKNTIGYKRAFLRDSIWIIIEFIAIVYFIRIAWSSIIIDEELRYNYDDVLSLISIFWLLLELITMMFNSKRRAIHDFFAKSVVIKIK